MPSDSLESLHDLFLHELRDLYDAENQLLKALPQMSQAAQSPELKRAFDTHLRETREQVRRIEQVFRGLGEKPTGKSCKAMQGLVAEGKELLEEDGNADVMDAALIVAAQKVEHYEIAGYGSVCTFGRILGYNDATELLKQTIDEEERTDKLLTEIAMTLNIEAETAEGGETSRGRGNAQSENENEESAGTNRMARGSTGTGSSRMGSRGRSSSRGGNARGGSTSRGRSRSSGNRRTSRSGRSRSTARSR